MAKRNSDLNDWHITNIQQDDSLSSKQIIRATSDKSLIWQSAISAFLVLSLLIPQGTQAAGLLSFFTFWKDNSKPEIKSNVYNATQYDVSLSGYGDGPEEYNSQNLPLPKATLSPNYRNSIGGSELTLADDAVLSAKHSIILPSEDGQDKTFNPKDTIKVYVVQKGDTLSEIAEKFGVSVNTIRWANDLGRNGLIKVGQELVILPIDGVKYKVKHGGTLRDIVKKIGGNLEEASVFNDLDPDEELAAGTEVIIPGAEIKEKKKKAKKIRSYITNYGSGKAVYKGYFMRPVKGGVRTQGLHGKNAVDIASTYGAAIYAAASGKVIISKYGAWNGGYGNYVVISHPNGTQTLYAHLAKNLVKRGEYVQQGQLIGTMGSTGKSTGVHLHFEVRGARNPF